jgi:hypothetical protein
MLQRIFSNYSLTDTTIAAVGTVADATITINTGNITANSPPVILILMLILQPPLLHILILPPPPPPPLHCHWSNHYRKHNNCRKIKATGANAYRNIMLCVNMLRSCRLWVVIGAECWYRQGLIDGTASLSVLVIDQTTVNLYKDRRRGRDKLDFGLRYSVGASIIESGRRTSNPGHICGATGWDSGMTREPMHCETGITAASILRGNRKYLYPYRWWVCWMASFFHPCK